MGTLLTTIAARLHPLELANKRFWLAVLRRIWHNRPLAKKLDPASVRRVLFIRYDVIGDMITTLPTIERLKRLNPAIEIDVLASPANRRIIEHDPNVSRIFIRHRSLVPFLEELKKMRRRKYDVVIPCIFGSTSIVGIFSNLIGGPKAVKATIWRGERYDFLFNVQSMAAYHQRSYWDRMLYILPDTFDFDFDPDDVRPYIAIDEGSHAAAERNLAALGLLSGGFVLLNLSVRRERNRWSREGYDSLISALLARDPERPILLLSTAEEAGLAREIIATHGAGGRIVIYPATGNVLEVISVIGRSRLVVTPDTGVVHMAAATGRPVMTLYADERAAGDWAPYRVPYRALFADWKPVSTIPPEEAVAALNDLLDEIEGRD